MALRRALLLLVGLGAAACAMTSPGPATGAPTPVALDSAAHDVVAFLRGQAPFERLRLADTVELRVAPEGGDARIALSRDALRDRARWVVGRGGAQHVLLPPTGLPRLTTKVGAHFACREQRLASRAPDLASLPHVGVRLTPDTTASCLQSWNLTLVFAPDEPAPRLVAAVYDQWEW
ncbi:MAG TPA: hypothetical protein VEA99_00135 [Gemmatimonadaceae bacterium]|nr:hypothetical protein [Gemmatimonadaceae bacterium]